jgi:RND family efflux transporter MFP subunit
VGVVKVTRQDLSNELRIASEFIPFQEIDVTAKVSGYIKKLNIDWGSHVHQGQLMAVLEVPELDAQVAKDRAAVERADKDVARAEQDLSRAQSAYTVAHVTYTRLAGVQKVRPDLVSQEDVDVAHGKDLGTAASVSAAQDALAAAQQELQVANSSLAKDEAYLNYARITAPFDGVVTRLDGYLGALLPAGTSNATATLPLCRLSQNNLLRLVIPVPERVVPDIHVGKTVNVQVTALNRVFPGKVIRFSGQIDLATRTMHTEVQVPNPNYEIVPGMYAYVQIPLQSEANVLAVPIQAVESTTEGKGTVLVVNSQNKIESRPVTLGIQTANEVEIVSGVRENELVVFGEQNRYRPGETVSPKLVDVQKLLQVSH